VSLHRSYEKANRCTTGPSPGAKALMSWFLGQYQARGGCNLGIFNCRRARGSTTTTSLHGEGRACDFGINPHGAQYGTDLAEQLRLHSGELGIQCVIWNRRIWSGSYPDAGWRAYSGVNPHVDHIHLELSRAAAQSLTPERVHQVLAGPALEEDELSQQQVDQIRRDIGFARDQILTRLGVPTPDRAPAKLPPEQLAGIDPARRVDVGYARDQLMDRLAALEAIAGAQASIIESIAEKLGIPLTEPGA
jgi:hypothetical protein